MSKYYIEDGSLFEFSVEQDYFADSPRDTDFNLGTMAIWWHDYALGDRSQVTGDPEEYIDSLIDSYMKNISVSRPKLKALSMNNDFCLLNLYVLEHSGLWLSTSSFSDPWDSGCAGFIWTDKKRFESFYGSYEGDWKQKATEILKSEVEEYNAYLQGSVYAATVRKYNTESQCFESYDCCGNFIDTDYSNDFEEYVLRNFTFSEELYEDLEEALKAYKRYLVKNNRILESFLVA